MKSLPLKHRHLLLVLLLLIVFLLRAIPGGGDYYTSSLYPIIGSLLSPLSGWLPFAVGDLFIAGSIAWVVAYPFYAVLHQKKKKKVAAYHVAEYLLWVYAWFYMAWGLNYSQSNVFQRTGMRPVEVSKEKFRTFAYNYADSLNRAFEKKGKQYQIKEIQQAYQKLGRKEGINLPFNSSPHAKTMVFSRLSSMAGVTGSMGPFFCEFTLNGDVLPHDYPATYAHEYAHFLGIANEGEANFYSYITCTTSDDEYVKFSGYYHILFHVLANVYDLLGDKEGDAYLRHINPKIIQLAKSDRSYWTAKRCTLLDNLQDFLFDLYLKGNHVAEGRKSYSGVIGIIMAWESLNDAQAR